MIDVTLDGPDELSFDQNIKLKVKIPRNGDLISHMYLKFNIPDIISDDELQFYWTKSLGTSIIDYIDLFIGGYKVERLYGDFLDILNNLQLSHSKKESYDSLIGNDDFMNYDARYKTGYYPGYDNVQFDGTPMQNGNKSYINKFYKTDL